MRLLQLLILCFIFVSCGTSKIKYVRTKNQPREVIQKREFSSNLASADLIQEETIEPANDAIETIVTEDLAETKSDLSPESKLRVEQNESVQSDDRVEAAIRAERQAKSAQGHLIASTALLPMIFFPLATLAGIIVLIVGGIKFARANRSRYITLPGERALSRAKTFLIISTSILAVLVLLVLVTLLLFW